MHQILLQFLATRYDAVKTQFPAEGRRRWHLRVLEEFWTLALNNDDLSPDPNTNVSSDAFMQDDDPFDDLSEGQELGLLLRTDFSNEDAWKSFCTILEGAEKELAETVQAKEKPDEAAEEGPSSHLSGSDSDDDDGSLSGVPSPIIKVINPPPSTQSVFTNMSNLTALRLFNDVDVRQAPKPPSDRKRIYPPNRLIDQGKWQEIYSGVNIWIYDALSNADQCVRLISQEGDFYGTATGDSWRVRGTHLCELQFNLCFLGMGINFGGLDKWDSNERQRNIVEASQGLV